ncbi:hypothetical protein DFH11DRAFT_1864359 [Phellopilus nigrolimitatus]|nr:hypothetical protein DFH11DRAFT_1864359 [Phellopilus nigrolimitatus]
MHIHDGLLFPRDCVECPSQAPECQCGTGFQCVYTSRSCSACPSYSCVAAAGDSSGSGGGVSPGAIAGGVIGALLFLAASVALLIFYRRRQRAAKEGGPVAIAEAAPKKSDVPARAEAVLSRPDPVEKPRSPSPQEPEPESLRMYSVLSNSTINLDPHARYSSPSSHPTHPSARGSLQSNPFTDTHSIQTTSASTQSTNVIPIALVPHGSVASPPHSPASDKPSGASSSISTVPSRPTTRAPDLGLRFDPLSPGLNLEHVNVSKESFPRAPNAPYAHSQASGISGISSRASVMTSGSFASDMIYEAPQILTSTSGRVGVAKAEVISVPGSTPNTPMTADGLKPSAAARASRQQPGRSPLAKTSFGPADTLGESDMEGQEIEYTRHDPFGDEHTPRLPQTGDSTSTFGGVTTAHAPNTHQRPQNGAPATRPTSTLTQAASIIGAEIAGATVVRLDSAARGAEHRMTSAKLVSPSPSAASASALQAQQAHALATARARAAASGLPPPPNPRRVSEASVASAGGDSLLESFTFVPPSPISSRPPRSPLAQQATTLAAAQAHSQQQQQQQQAQQQAQGDGSTAPLNPPRTRQQQGLSTVSTNSSLEGYTFHIDQGLGQGPAPPLPPVPAAAMAAGASKRGLPHQRASLDTLALTADLSAFPLNFDEGRGSFDVSK